MTLTTSLDLLQTVYDTIVAANTASGNRVYKPGDWPTQPDQYPITKLRLVSEDRQSLGRGGPPQFATVATIRIVSEVSAPAQLDDLGASDAEAALWSLKRQVEVAIVNSYPLEAMIEQIASMRSQLAFNSDSATHLAGIQTDVALEFYEGPESFAPATSDDLDEVDVTTSGPAAAINIPTT